MKKILSTAIAIVLGASSIQAQDGTDLDTLLNKVKNGVVTETSKYKDRVNKFRTKQVQQDRELRRARTQKRNLEIESDKLAKRRRDLTAKYDALQESFKKEKGKLADLLGVLQQGASDAKAVLSTSHISIDFPERSAAIDNLVAKAKDENKLPTSEEIRSWPHAMMKEMIESRNVKKFTTQVWDSKGNPAEREIVRLGDFGFVSDGAYLYLHDGKVKELPRQPGGRILNTAAPFFAATDGLQSLGMDPTRGQIMAMEVDKATFEDQVKAGGSVGYLILSLGAVAVLLAVVQFLYLMGVKAKVRSQIKNATPNTNNPLGRVLQVYADNPSVDVETLELKLDEAILKETPALERFLTLIKLISAVAPLFGLLGTVTGMIETFQSITLFGTGDPKMMASGISMALVTTVEGLVVAIPSLLLHSFVSGASKSVIHILEEQSAGIIAVHAEKGNANAQ